MPVKKTTKVATEEVDKAEGVKPEVPEISGTDAQLAQIEQDHPDADKIGVEYINPQVGMTVREFTLETHGEGFKDIAKGFADKFAGRIVAIS